MKRKLAIELICCALITLFMYAGIVKLAGHSIFSDQLNDMPFINHASSMLSYALPLIEVLVALMLAIPLLRQSGLYASLVLLVVFTVYIGYMIVFKAILPCSCGGLISKLSWQQHVLFNLFFIILNVAGIKLQSTVKASKENIIQLFIAINRSNRKPV